MAQSTTKLLNCGNDFYPHLFDRLCSTLEDGLKVKAYIDCIGHTRNNMVQDIYKEKIEEKYGDKVRAEREPGGYSYSYIYQLIK